MTRYAEGYIDRMIHHVMLEDEAAASSKALG